MFLRRSLLAIIFVTVAAFFCAQSVEAAAKGPKITNKVYFDIKHGDKELGRSTCPVLLHLGLRSAEYAAQSLWGFTVV